jgi:hypothetical protein
MPLRFKQSFCWHKYAWTAYGGLLAKHCMVVEFAAMLGLRIPAQWMDATEGGYWTLDTLNVR